MSYKSDNMLSPENRKNVILIMKQEKKKCDIKFVINFQRWASREKVKIYMYYICFNISLHNIDVHIYENVNNHINILISGRFVLD